MTVEILEKLRYLTAKDGFLGLEDEDAVAPEAAKAVIIPFGLEASVSYTSGTAKGPDAILHASHQVELFDEELWSEPFREYGVATVEQPNIAKDIPEALEQLEKLTESVLASGRFPMILGGEHSITAGSIRPFAKRFEKLSILHFDAHADLRDGYDGEFYSHASAMRRVLDHPNVNLVSIGIRNISSSEIPFYDAERDRIHIFWGKDRESWNIHDIVNSLKGYPVYLSFDVDGFDSSLMPATGTPEPGGVFWNDAMRIIRAASEACTIVGADVNELAPREGFHACDFLAAKLVYKILSYALAGKKS